MLWKIPQQSLLGDVHQLDRKFRRRHRGVNPHRQMDVIRDKCGLQQRKLPRFLVPTSVVCNHGSRFRPKDAMAVRNGKHHMVVQQGHGMRRIQP